MNNTFSSQTLAEKLSTINNSQQSIETLSHWCVFHRKKAQQIVETWEKLFNSSSKEQRVSFLYLANDILQNSRRKGSEFVNEFWKVLPGTLKSVCENGDDRGKNVVMRLVDIWDERKVFGSRGQGLKDDILGQTPLPSDNNGKSSNPIKVLRKDAHSIRIKLAVGGMPEKIVTAYQSLLDEHFNEDTALNKCNAAVRQVGKMEKDIDDACSQGIQQGLPLMNEIQEQEAILKQCIEQLESVEATRAALIAKLKEALQEQESKLELIRTQLQAAQTETECAVNMRQRLVSVMVTIGPTPSVSPCTTITSQATETAPITVPNPPLQISSTPPQPSQPMTSFAITSSSPSPKLSQPPTPFTNSLNSSPLQSSQPVTSFSTSSSTPPPQPSLPVTSFTNSFSSPHPPSQPVTPLTNSFSAEEQNKKAAAAIAAKLTASTSSAQMLTSVLSSLAAEEAASMNGGLGGAVFSNSPPVFPVNKRPKLEKPMSVSDMSNEFFGHMQRQLTSLPLALPQVSATSMQPLSQTNQPPPPFPPPPPLPPMPRPPMLQYLQTSGVMTGVVPYSFGGSALPPWPLSSDVSVGLARHNAPQPPPPPPPPPPPTVPPPQQQQQQQQSSATLGFIQQPGIGFYGQLQMAPPVPTTRDR